MKRTASAYGNCYMFTARQWDAESNLYYYRARMYDPNLGRFLQADPVGYSADINLYRYCSNNPINRIDPSGLEGKKKKSKTGHMTITRYAYPHGRPIIIETWNSGKYELTQEFMDWYFKNFGGKIPEGSMACVPYIYWLQKVSYWVTENWDFIDLWKDIMEEEMDRIKEGIENLFEMPSPPNSDDKK